jgi:hypothetical protein
LEKYLQQDMNSSFGARSDRKSIKMIAPPDNQMMMELGGGPAEQAIVDDTNMCKFCMRMITQ